jgi:hypothetical protein
VNLTWRARTVAADAATGNRPAPIAQPPSTTLAASNPSNANGRPPSTGIPVMPPTAIRAALFEPSTLERFTDDVMQRIERRLRIARERRGG